MGDLILVNKLMLICILSMLFLSSISLNVESQENDPPVWNDNYKFRQEIFIPIKTDNDYAKFQPIDVEIEFRNLCWGISEKEHSIRIVVWTGIEWYEIDL
jgi:hypothetical protein